MLWEQGRNEFYYEHPIPEQNRSRSLSHDFSDRPFMNNSSPDSMLISKSPKDISTELWHYGVKGMHWGEITKEYKKKGYSSRNTGNSKSVFAKISKLKAIKAKLRQRRLDRMAAKRTKHNYSYQDATKAQIELKKHNDKYYPDFVKGKIRTKKVSGRADNVIEKGSKKIDEYLRRSTYGQDYLSAKAVFGAIRENGKAFVYHKRFTSMLQSEVKQEYENAKKSGLKRKKNR